MFMEWDYSVMEEFLLPNLISVDQLFFEDDVFKKRSTVVVMDGYIGNL